MTVPRCCTRCHVVVSDRQRCPCIVCRACTTDGGLAGPGCACGREPLGAPGDPVAPSSQRRADEAWCLDTGAESWDLDGDPVTDIERGIELARAGHG